MANPTQGNNHNDNEPRRPKKQQIWAIIAAILIFFLSYRMMGILFAPEEKEVTYDVFIVAAQKGEIEKVELAYERISYTLKADTEEQKTIYYTVPLPYDYGKQLEYGAFI